MSEDENVVSGSESSEPAIPPITPVSIPWSLPDALKSPAPEPPHTEQPSYTEVPSASSVLPEPVSPSVGAASVADTPDTHEPHGTTDASLISSPPPSAPVYAPAPGSPVLATAGGAALATKAPKKPRSFLVELPVLVAIALVLALILKAFAVQAFFIPSGSMETTLLIKDRVLVNKLSYDFHDPRRGDIVVFNGKHTNFPNESVIKPASNPLQSGLQKVQRFLGLGAPDESDFIKRVIAVGGDTIQCCTDGHVVVNGKVLNESYIYQDNALPFCLSTVAGTSSTVPASGPACNTLTAKPFVVPKGTLFVMGDHRSLSADSRYEGVIPKSAVIGRAFVLIWPLNRLDRFGTPPDFSH